MDRILRHPTITRVALAGFAAGAAAPSLAGCDTLAVESEFCREWRPEPDAIQELWRYTDPEGVPAEAFEPVPLRLNLPLARGTAAVIAQGHDTTLTHRDSQRFALDFDVPIGTPVHAAAGGIVVSAVAGNVAWGLDETYRNSANRITVDHGRGLFSAYVHLAADGVFVVPGERVDPGDVIGLTGYSGQMSGPHLHFHVENAWSRTLPFRLFDPDTERCDGLYLEGETALASPAEWFQHEPHGDAPPDLFEDFQVVDINGFPSRLFRRETTYRVSGATTLKDATEVLFMLLPQTGGEAIAGRRFEVASDGTFQGALTLGTVPTGEYGWALAATTDGAASVERSVRCAVVP